MVSHFHLYSYQFSSNSFIQGNRRMVVAPWQVQSDADISDIKKARELKQWIWDDFDEGCVITWFVGGWHVGILRNSGHISNKHRSKWEHFWLSSIANHHQHTIYILALIYQTFSWSLSRSARSVFLNLFDVICQTSSNYMMHPWRLTDRFARFCTYFLWSNYRDLTGRPGPSKGSSGKSGLVKWVFPKIGVKPPKWMVPNPMNKWMIWGVKPPPIFGFNTQIL